MNGLSLLPTLLVDIIGSAANILFAFLSLRCGYLLTRRQPENFLWSYLFYVTIAIAAFSISRAAGHLVKHFLLIAGMGETWKAISAYSGGFNTLCMISVAAVMIFYHKGVQAYEAIEHEADKLKNANEDLANVATQLRELNQTLEQKVEERTAELSSSEKKFRHLYSASKDVVFFTDATHQVVDINGSGLELLGYTAGDSLHLEKIFAVPEQVRVYEQLLGQDGYIKDMEVEFSRNGSELLSVLLSATAIYNDQGQIIGSEAIAKDLTRVKTMMAQMVANEKMASVGQMAAGVAHEINTPLGVILGYAQLMMDDFAKDSETYDNLKVIERQTKASRKIVADLLKFSRQSGSIREQLDVNELIGDVVAVTEHILKLSHIEVVSDCAGDLPAITGDPEKLRQVLVNLVNNAHHAMEERGGGRLTLRALHDDNGGVCIEVEDTGHGITDEVRAKIFDPFFTTKPVGQGTGLGLSVSYGIIRDHGGRIEVVSPAREDAPEGAAGTRFIIYLPADKGEMAAVEKITKQQRQDLQE
ncbi:MAG: PAS domain-containing sensor histidine kinase [Deltaproteobacteria bacterium]|nr:MAG: PAS domain-containing sensor histidine kinase [Deltaproteobacteria bacterium]